MYLDKIWVEELMRRYGKHPKILRDTLWPNTKTKGLGYFDKTKKLTIDTLEVIADVIGCSMDELLRRPSFPTSLVNGNNNLVGNVTVTNDPETLRAIILAQNNVIVHQDEEIKRLNASYKEQLKVKDQQIEDFGKRFDRLINFVQGSNSQ